MERAGLAEGLPCHIGNDHQYKPQQDTVEVSEERVYPSKAINGFA